MKIKRCKLLLLFLLLHVCVMAQTAGYHYQADITHVDSSGFYNIVLTPEINKHLKNGYSDFRIINDAGKWVPHLFRAPNDEFINDMILLDLKIVKIESSNLNTDIIIESYDSSINNLFLKIKNTEAERFCNITGSDDLIKWFIINDSIAIKPQKINYNGNSSFSIKFPPVNYKYLRIHINNMGKEPFNIINIACETTTPSSLIQMPLTKHSQIENPPCVILQKDSGKNSYIKIIQEDSFHFDQLQLKLSGAKYYSRTADIVLSSSAENIIPDSGELINTIEISNNSFLKFPLPAIKTKVFYIVIHNEDNLPLKVDHVTTSIGYVVATAWLEKANQYSILVDNPSANTPNYDIQKKDLYSHKEFPIAQIGKFIAIQPPAESSVPSSNNKWLIWLLIVIAILVLAFFTYKLITDINKSKS